ncbi:MAG: hypothetical protein KGL02_06825 [Acidobacteriota bacterium]|nr:hypothetical protein [Acidobacteriota bacterium]
MLFDSPQKEHHSKLRRYIISIVVFVVLVIGTSWYLLRYYREKDTVRRFLDEVAAGDMQQAYQTWKPETSYSFKDFLDDWGPGGYYGPVRSFRVEKTVRRHDSNYVDVIVEVSSVTPFPSGNADSDSRTREVDIGVRLSDQKMSFPPPAL